VEAIGRQWYQLYENNPKIQAFAVIKDGAVVWQTENWDLVDDVKSILKAQESASSKITVAGVKYKRVTSSEDSYIASADKEGGHFLMARIDKKSWALAWAEHTSIPELTLIDLSKSVIVLKDNV
jgi:hypothetical protein